MPYVLPTELEPSADAKTIDAAMKWLVDTKDEFNGTTNFARFYDDATLASRHVYAPCHGGLGRAPLFQKKVACVATEFGWWRRFIKTSKYLQNYVKIHGYADKKGKVDPSLFCSQSYLPDEHCTVETVIPFVDWLVNRSYMAPMFLVKDMDFILQFGFILNTNVPAPLLQNAAIATRHLYEGSLLSFELFNKFVKQGMNEDFAFNVIFGSSLSHAQYGIDSAGKVTYHMDNKKWWSKCFDERHLPYYNIYGHRVHGVLTDAEMVAYLNRKPTEDLPHTILYSDAHNHTTNYIAEGRGPYSYYGGYTLWRKQEQAQHPSDSRSGSCYKIPKAVVDYMRTLPKEISDYRLKNKASAGPTKVVDPFAPPSYGGGNYDRPMKPEVLRCLEAVEVFIPAYYEEIMKKFNASKETARVAA